MHQAQRPSHRPGANPATGAPQQGTDRLILGVLIAACCAVAPATVIGETVNWNMPLGFWSDATAWEGGIAPTADDQVRIASGAVSINTDTATVLQLDATQGTATSVTAGTLDVAGTLNMAGQLVVMDSGTAQLQRLQTSASANLLVQGPSAALVLVPDANGDNGGFYHRGYARIDAAGRIQGESLDNYQELWVTAGATAAFNSALNHTGSSLEVQGTDSAMLVTGSTTNRGALTASSAGRFTSESFDNFGAMNLTDGATGNANSLVNHTGASVTVQGGSALQVSGLITNRGDWVVQGPAASVSADQYLQQAGHTWLRGDGHLTANALRFEGGELTGTGQVSGNAGFSGTAVLSPGNGPAARGEIEFTNSLDLFGILAIELGGLNWFDQVLVGADANLGGTLRVSLFNNYTPEIGDSFDIVLANAVFDGFDRLILPQFSGRTFDVVYGADFVRLTTTPVPLPPAGLLLAAALGVLGLRRRARPLRFLRPAT